MLNGLEKAERARALHAVRLLSQWTLSQLQWQPPQEGWLPLLSPLLGLFYSSVEHRGSGQGKPLSVRACSDSVLGVIASLTPPGTFLDSLYLCSWKPQRIFLEFCSQRNPPWLLGYQMFKAATPLRKLFKATLVLPWANKLCDTIFLIVTLILALFRSGRRKHTDSLA